MAEETNAGKPLTDATSKSSGLADATKTREKRKNLISPTSSFVDFTELDTELYTQEDKDTAHLYEPFQHRKIKKPTTTFETCVHMLKGVIGAGVLTMPKAFQNAGYGLGVPGTILLGSLCVYGVHLMLTMQRIQCQRLRVPFLTLPRSLKIAFLNGPKPFPKMAWLAPYYVDFFLVSNQIGLCASYVVFISTSIHKVLAPRIGEFDKRICMAAIFIPVLAVNYVRNLKKMMPISLVADVFTAIALGCCFYFIFGTGPFKLDEAKVLAHPSTWPLFIGTVMFALEAIGVMIVLEHNMKSPQYFLGFKGIMPWSMFVVMTLYMGLGLCSYLKYGEDTKESVIASLPDQVGEKGEYVAVVAQLTLALAIFGSYPIQCYVGLEIIWGNYLVHWIKNCDRDCLIEYTLRTSFVVLSFIIAVAARHVDLVIALVGAFCLSTLGLIIPFLLELCTKWPDGLGPWKYILVKDILCIIFGFSILLIGTYTSVISIYTGANKE